MNKTNILIFVTPTHYPVIMGGTLGRLLKWSKYFNKVEFNVHILISGYKAENLKSLQLEYLKNEVDVSIIPNITLPRILFDFKTQLKLYKYVRKIKPDIIHTLFIQSDIIMGIFKKKLGVLYLISSIEGAPYLKGTIKSYLYKLLYYLIRLRIDKVIALCSYSKKQVNSEYNVIAERTEVIYSGLNVNNFDFPKRINSDQKNLKIGFLGDISEGKRISLFIDIIPDIIEIYPNTRFIVGGIGSDLNKMKNIVKEKKIDKNVEFKGFIYDVNSFYKEIDLYVFLSHREGLPWVILESQAAGVPTIASNVGGVSEIINDNINGKLLKAGNREELINELLSLMQDHNRRQRFSNESRKRVCENFSIEKEVQDIQNVYKSLCSSD